MNKQRNDYLTLSLLIITAYSFLTYFLFIPFLGFYNDDWFFAYVGHFYGVEGIIKSLVIDRPFDGYLLALNYFILRNNILLWHIYMFLIRLIGGYVLFFLLNKLYPKKFSVITSITLLFLIYPGFLQQTSPLGYQNFLTTLTIWITSLAFTILAIKNFGKVLPILFTLIALITQCLSFLLLEFFIGMEVLRLLLLFYMLKIREINFIKIKKKMIYWAPYVVTLILFILWRIFIFKSTRETTDINWVTKTYYSNLLWMTKIPLEILYSFTSTIIFAYFLPIVINFVRIPTKNSIISLFIGITSATLLYFYYKKIEHPNYDKNSNGSTNRKKFGKKLLLIGLISIVGALIPIIISGRFVRMFLVYDRYTISSLIGVGFILVGLLLFKFTKTAYRWIMILLVSLSVTSHLMNSYFRAINWDKQKEIWWQLYWRSPKIKNNATLIFDFPSLAKKGLFTEIINKVQWYRIYWVDYQIWAPGNLFFNYDNSPQNHFRGDFLPDKGILDKIRNQVVENLTDRNITYTRDFENTVIISTPSDTSCLWVLDKNRYEFPSHADELLKSSIAYSDVDNLVKTESSTAPPQEIFGHEPSHGWCYYFQKASLARQLKDGDKLRQLKKEVIQKNLKPKDPNEWLLFQKVK